MKKILVVMIMAIGIPAFAEQPIPAWTCSGYCGEIYLEADGDSAGDAFKNLRSTCQKPIQQPASARGISLSFGEYGHVRESQLSPEFIRATIQNSCVKN